MILAENRYGKQRVRVLKLFRHPEHHSVRELTVSCLLQGDFTEAHCSGDNSKVVPTDTIRNTIHILAQDALTENAEAFALHVANHFLTKYPQVTGVELDSEERVWQAMEIGGKVHPHSFVERGQGTPTVRLAMTRDEISLASGIQGLLLMKTTGSGFAGFPKCEFTTLPETTDRIMATRMEAAWTHTNPASAGPEVNAAVLEMVQRVFATTWSPSVQRTLYQMGEAVLEALPGLDRISFKLPNQHYLPLDLSRFGREIPSGLFLPTDEPHGQIEAVVRRER